MPHGDGAFNLRWRFAATLAAAGALAALALVSPASSAPQDAPRTASDRASEPKPAPPVVSAASAPAGTESLSVQWVNVAAPGRGVMMAAVARPAGAGPFPAVLILHGTHGFAQEYVRLAQELARGGVIAVAACWFTGGGGGGAGVVTPPIACPEAPAMPEPFTPDVQQSVDALVQAVRTLPGVRADRVALFGHSRGAGATLQYVLLANVQAAVLEASGYADRVNDRAAEAKAPILILHGTADGPANAGSPATAVERARGFEAALRQAGKPVEAHYYEGGEHNSLFTNPTQHEDQVRRIAAFLQRHLIDQ